MQTLKAIFSKRMLIVLAMGFASGVPFVITKDILKAWLTDANIDITTIGLVSGLSLPYTLKFLWAPLMDRFTPPLLGRRRGWILGMQAGLIVTIGWLGQFDPNSQLTWITLMALALTFFSASQDIVIDAYRREFLPTSELGLGSAVYMNAYRLANLATLGVAMLLADSIGYANVHLLLAGLMAVGVLGVLLAPEPKLEAPPPGTLREAVVEPFREFFQRPGAILILLFIVLYKIGDNMASAMNVPFILKLGFEKAEYFAVVKGLGMVALFFGMFLGGVLMMRMTLLRALVLFGILQMVSTAGFALLAIAGKSHAVLIGAVVFELLSTGLGTTAYATFMALQTNTRFTATQYALMSSLMAVPGTVVSMITGYLAKFLGWPLFYGVCVAAAIPGLLLIPKVCPKTSPDTKRDSQ